jgi:hypothetical protein
LGGDSRQRTSCDQPRTRETARRSQARNDRAEALVRIDRRRRPLALPRLSHTLAARTGASPAPRPVPRYRPAHTKHGTGRAHPALLRSARSRNRVGVVTIALATADGSRQRHRRPRASLPRDACDRRRRGLFSCQAPNWMRKRLLAQGTKDDYDERQSDEECDRRSSPLRRRGVGEVRHRHEDDVADPHGATRNVAVVPATERKGRAGGGRDPGRIHQPGSGESPWAHAIVGPTPVQAPTSGRHRAVGSSPLAWTAGMYDPRPAPPHNVQDVSDVIDRLREQLQTALTKS